MDFDITVIGSGPGGYVAAIRAAQLGFKTAIIEKYASLGGTCGNVGCIPSKAMLDVSEHYHLAKERFKDYGINISGLKADMQRMVDRKAEVVSQTADGVAFLMKKNKIQIFHGHASFKDNHNLEIRKDDGSTESVSSDKIIIATGSKPLIPSSFNFDKNRVISSTEALNINKVPKRMVIVGAGVIGLELGSVFARLGTEVEVVEYLDRILATMDKDCSRELMRSMKKLGVKFHLSHEVTGVNALKTGVKVMVAKRDSDESFELKADYCLVAIGRRPYTDNLGLENTGVELDEKGRIRVDQHLRTAVDNIYAIGDVIEGPMLAHKAEEDGIFAVETIAGQKPHLDYNLVPLVVYTWPEVAAVGKTENELKSEGIPYKSGKFPVRALGRARASGDMEGMVKVLSHETTDEILGVHMVSARAADMIMEGVAVMEFKGAAEDIARICHPHPTYTEAIREAALGAAADRPLHM